MDKIGDVELNSIYCSDAVEFLKRLPDCSINCIVTSPPYYGLRDYAVDGQIGRESTPYEYVNSMAEVFKQAYRVLRKDGTLWLNIADSYAGTGDKNGLKDPKYPEGRNGQNISLTKKVDGIKSKSLIGIPWRIAFSLIDIGFILRSDIIWHKPNAMPESVQDRPSRSHEYVFLLTKTGRYWYNSNALNQIVAAQGKKKARTVWSVTVARTKIKHFATFPPKLIKPMITAGCPPMVCSACGTPYSPSYETTIVDKTRPQSVRALELAKQHGLTQKHFDAIRAVGFSDSGQGKALQYGAGRNTDEIKELADHAKNILGGYFREFTFPQKRLTGYLPACLCNAESHAGIVLDPFMGSGTTALVAKRLGYNWVGCDLNEEYCTIARERLAEPTTLNLFKEEDYE